MKNKQVTKHFTEKTIKEVWKEKLAERKTGRESDMCDFVCNFFQKRIGIMSAVVEASSCPMNQFHDSINRGSICMHVYLGPSLLASQTESPSCYHLTCTRSVLWCAQEVELTKE